MRVHRNFDGTKIEIQLCGDFTRSRGRSMQRIRKSMIISILLISIVLIFTQNCSESDESGGGLFNAKEKTGLNDDQENVEDLNEDDEEQTVDDKSSTKFDEITLLSAYDDFEAELGSNIELKLEIESSDNLGNLEYRWYKDNKIISNSSNLSISSFHESDEGIYYGVVQNEIDIQQTVEFKIRKLTDHDFGGMYGEGPSTVYNNPLTGGRSCPRGFTSQKVNGALRHSGEILDASVYFCFRKHVKGNFQNALDFGGLFGRSLGKDYPNPFTGNLSCPKGFTRQQVKGDTQVNNEGEMYYCHRPASIGNVTQFGGMIGGETYRAPDNVVRSRLINNPITGSGLCPIGYDSYEGNGAQNYDYKVTYCMRE